MKDFPRVPLLILIGLALFVGACGRRKFRPEELERNELFSEIMMREDRRDPGEDGFLRRNLLYSPHPEVREWSAIALGRIGSPAGLPWLYQAFRSEYADVRAAAAFAVGEIEDRDQVEAEFRSVDARASVELISLLDDPAPRVRMRAVEALGKIGLPSNAKPIEERLETLLYNGAPDQRAYLDLAITALLRIREPSSIPVIADLAAYADPEIQWRAANALYRMRANDAKATFLRLLDSPHADVRAHAARGIGICGDPSLADLLVPLLPPTHPGSGRPNPLSVRVCALQALGHLKNARGIPGIQAALRASPIVSSDPDQVNFAIQAAAALGRIGAREAEAVLIPLIDIRGPVANSAIVAIAQLWRGDDRFFELVDIDAFDTEEGLRALVRALGELGGRRAVGRLKSVLARAIDDHASPADVRAIPLILDSLAQARTEDLEAILLPFLASRDGVVVKSAVRAYTAAAGAGRGWRPLLDAYRGLAPHNEVEAKVEILNALEPWLKESEVVSALRLSLTDHQRNVRIAATRLLRKAGATDTPADPGRSGSATPDTNYALIASLRSNRTFAVIETVKGSIEIELFRKDAPLTVANFIRLARAGYFDGLTFMRVVPFFVIQGGDPRNDMEGGPGYDIRCEINMRPFNRGSVGMALSGKDTGGSQFFITLSPQPHLDGGYTCFGRVTSGMTAVERMVEGDRILRVRIREDATLFDNRRF